MQQFGRNLHDDRRTGTCSVIANQAGNSNYVAASLGQSTTAAKSTTTTAVVSSQNPQLVNLPVTFTATVSGQFGGLASGTISFKYGTTTIIATLAPNQASFTTSFAAAGTRSITAVYAGDTNNTGTTSAAVSQSVVAKFATTTTLTSNLNPAFVGQPGRGNEFVTPNSVPYWNRAIGGPVRLF